MTADRIKEIQDKTAYPDSISVQQALLKVWNECKQEQSNQVLTPVVDGQSEQSYCPNCYVKHTNEEHGAFCSEKCVEGIVSF